MQQHRKPQQHGKAAQALHPGDGSSIELSNRKFAPLGANQQGQHALFLT